QVDGSCTSNVRIIHQPRKQVTYHRSPTSEGERNGIRPACLRVPAGRPALAGDHFVWGVAAKSTGPTPNEAEASHAALQRDEALGRVDANAPPRGVRAHARARRPAAPSPTTAAPLPLWPPANGGD